MITENTRSSAVAEFLCSLTYEAWSIWEFDKYAARTQHSIWVPCGAGCVFIKNYIPIHTTP